MKKKLFLLLCALLTMIGVQAQTDVTSTYITNAGFDNSTDFQTGNVATGNSNQRKTVTGWSNSGGDTYSTGAAIGFGTTGQINGANLPETNSDGTTTGGALCLNVGWASQVWYSQEVTFPAGNYVMTFKVNNVGQNNKFEKDPVMFSFTTADAAFSGNIHSYPVSTWTTQTITFALASETTGTIKIGYKGSANTGSGGTPKLVVDYVKAMYTNYTSTLQSAIDRATLLSPRVEQDNPSAAETLNSAIEAAQGVLDGADNTVAYQTTINNAVTTLRDAITTAQAEVTLMSGENITFMLENADFESSTPVSVGITTYDYDAASNGTSYSRMQVVEGWTIANNGNARSAGVFTYGGNAFLGSTGDSYTTKSVSSPTNEEKALGLVAVWSSSVQYKQNATLPAGRYVITVPVYNTAGTTAFSKNLIGFVENGGTEHLASRTTYPVGSWTTESISFDLNSETPGYFSLGYNAAGAGSAAMPHLFIDNVTITYTDAENAYAATVTSATATYNSATYAGVTGTERNALYDALNPSPAPSTVEEYFEAIDDINDAVSTFTSAKESYDKFDVEKTRALAIGVAEGDVVRPASGSAADLKTALRGLYVLEDAATTSGYTYDATQLIGEWDTQNTGSNHGQHWSGDDRYYTDKNSNAGFTMSLSKTVTLPAGKYVFKAAARAAVGGVWDDALTLQVTDQAHAIYDPQGDTGKGIDTSGAANYGDGTFANNNNGRGWEWRFIPFELAEEKSITLKVEAIVKANNWASFSDVQLLTSTEKVLLSYEISKANASYNSGANVGTGVFQITEEAGDDFVAAIATAQAVYDNGSATADDVMDAIDDLKAAEETFLTTLNAPDAEKRYCIVLSNNGSWEHDGKAMTYIANDRDDMGLYNVKYQAVPNANYAQAFVLTQVGGNTYKMSQTDVDGNTRYLCTGVPYSGNTSQIRTTTTAEDALVVKIIATGTENIFNIYNTEADQYIGSQDAGVYTVNSNKNFTISEASKATAKMQVSGVAKMGTFCAPFDVEIPDGVKAYTLSEGTNESWVHMNEVSGTKIAAGTPVLLTSDSKIDEAMEGYSVINAPDNSGLLQGAFVQTDVDKDAGNYLLQYQDGECAFYLVDSDDKKIGANRCYLHIEESGETPAARIVIGGGDDPTAINAVEAAAPEANTLKDGKYLIGNKIVLVKNGVKYGANGQKLN